MKYFKVFLMPTKNVNKPQYLSFDCISPLLRHWKGRLFRETRHSFLVSRLKASSSSGTDLL